MIVPYRNHFNRDTPASDVITGPSIGADSYIGIGAGIQVNPYGTIVDTGFGVGTGVATTWTFRVGGDVDTTSPTIERPVYDVMGSPTGHTEQVPNPNYRPPSDAYYDRGNTDHDGGNVDTGGDGVGYSGDYGADLGGVGADFGGF